jgi:hypothetical protein
MNRTPIVAIVVLFAACGHESVTAPTTVAVSPPTPVAPVPAPLLDGNYEITFTADAACTDLPSSARTRTYSASFDGSPLVYLGGADFARGSSTSYPIWNVLYVRVSGDSATIFFGDPPIWEHLTPESDLVINGDATGPVDGDTSQWSFGGSLDYCPAADRTEQSYPECEVPEISCRSRNHQLTLTRK